MLTTIAIIFLLLWLLVWLLGFIGFHILGNFIHFLLIIAVIFFLIRIIKGENPFK